jgi:hypothetical protein
MIRILKMLLQSYGHNSWIDHMQEKYQSFTKGIKEHQKHRWLLTRKLYAGSIPIFPRSFKLMLILKIIFEWLRHRIHMPGSNDKSLNLCLFLNQTHYFTTRDLYSAMYKIRNE